MKARAPRQKRPSPIENVRAARPAQAPRATAANADPPQTMRRAVGNQAVQRMLESGAPSTRLLLTQQGALGNAAVQRLLTNTSTHAQAGATMPAGVAIQREPSLSAELAKQRRRAMGLSVEEVRENFASEAGARATREAKGIAPSPLSPYATLNLENTLWNKQQTGPQDDIVTHLKSQPGPSLEQQQQAHQTRSILVNALDQQRRRARGLGQDALTEVSMTNPGARETKEAQSVTPTKRSPRQEKRLDKKIEQMSKLGPQDDIAAYFKEQKEQQEKARLEEEAKRDKERKATENKFAPNRKAHQVKQDKAKTAKENEAKKQEKEQKEWEYLAAARPILATATTLSQSIAAAHDILKAALDKSIAEAANEAIAALSGAPIDIKALDPLGVKINKAQTDFTQTKKSTENKHKNKVDSGMKYMQDKGLAKLLIYNDPLMRDTNTAIGNAITAEQWFTASELLPALEAEFKKIEAHHLEIKDISKRVKYLKTKPAVAPSVTEVENELTKKHTTPANDLDRYVKKMNQTLWEEQRDTALAEFNARANNNAAGPILEHLLDKRLIKKGQFNKKYRTSWDTQGGYSVEYTVSGLPNIVIHAHCEAGGTPKPGNGSHWKFKTQKFAPGASYQISDVLREKLIDPSDYKKRPIQKE